MQGYLQYMSNKILLQCIYSTCPLRSSYSESTVHVQEDLLYTVHVQDDLIYSTCPIRSYLQHMSIKILLQWILTVHVQEDPLIYRTCPIRSYLQDMSNKILSTVYVQWNPLIYMYNTCPIESSYLWYMSNKILLFMVHVRKDPLESCWKNHNNVKS